MHDLVNGSEHRKFKTVPITQNDGRLARRNSLHDLTNFCESVREQFSFSNGSTESVITGQATHRRCKEVSNSGWPKEGLHLSAHRNTKFGEID